MNRFLVAITLSCALRATAIAIPQDGGAGSGTYCIRVRVNPPVVVTRVSPEYTPEAKSARIEGTVVLGAVISKEGKVTVEKTIAVQLKNKDTGAKADGDYGLVEKAKEAVLQWKFKPGTRDSDGQAMDVRANIEVNFRLP